ncbi:expansin-like B1 [Beta vulgaris subsp. vulgaris]|uniref:expansin-like B1 n=1 Tax=Beta vulgaris subsp. vulgaris TaxID=3555 RepID=UPI002036D0EF|nr:expansin-like B1 [Beta vulgaris subsp. vulgaris]
MELSLDHKNSMLLLIMILLVVLGYGQDYICSRATYYGSPDCLGNPTGACGYGEYGRTVNDGYVAGVHRPYRNGTGCGGCYQVWCTTGECTKEGVIVVATDFGVGDWTDFLFPAKAYTKMARPGFEAYLLSYGVVDIQYRRVPCTFRDSNLIFSVHERTNYPHYFAITIIYPPGVYDVVGAQIWQEDCKAWRGMRKPYGAVWDMENPPRADLRVRFLLSATGNVNDATWVESPTMITAFWNSGTTYEVAVTL